jgi:hypothetical protein
MIPRPVETSIVQRHSNISSRGAWLALVLLLGSARVAFGTADFFIIPPVVIAEPGEVVQIPIEMSQSIDTLGVLAINYQLPIDPAFVTSVSLLPEGVVWSWGTPFTNITGTMVAVAATGGLPVSSTSTRFHTLQLTVSPTAPVNGAMPLSFSVLNVNEGTPVAQQNLGLLIIRTGTVGVAGGTRAGGLALEAAPNPMRGSTRLICRVPAGVAGERVALEVFALDGRRVRVLRDEPFAAGTREATWDGRDAAGRRVAPGVYLARLAHGAAAVMRRVVVVE